jgi:hypothetical protein
MSISFPVAVLDGSLLRTNSRVEEAQTSPQQVHQCRAQPDGQAHIRVAFIVEIVSENRFKECRGRVARKELIPFRLIQPQVTLVRSVHNTQMAATV